MKVVLQRVKSAFVEVEQTKISEISKGLLIFWGIEKLDSQVDSEVLVNKVLNLRIFSDENQKMNKSICDINGEILIVSQFTLAANTLKGNRPSFINDKDPNEAEDMIDHIVYHLSKSVTTKTGIFGAMMNVGLINDGPATFILSSKNGKLTP